MNFEKIELKPSFGGMEQIKECSLRTHLIQTRREEGEEDAEEETPPLLPPRKFPWP